MELKESIQKPINDNLPVLAAGELSDFIKQAKSDAEDLKKLKEEKKTVDGLLSEFRKKESEYNTAKQELAKAQELEKNANERQAKMELDLTKEKLSQRDFVISKFEGFLSLLVKNPRAIELISASESFNNGSHWSGGHEIREKIGSIKTETVEKKEIKSDSIFDS